jgi:hypothetical protein
VRSERTVVRPIGDRAEVIVPASSESIVPSFFRWESV